MIHLWWKMTVSNAVLCSLSFYMIHLWWKMTVSNVVDLND